MSDGTDGWLWVGVASDDRWEIVPEVRISLDWYNLLADDIGKLTSLTTADKSNLVAAINEVKQAADGKQDKITSTNKLAYSLISGTPTVPTVPTNVSAFTNDAGYLTLATLPKYEGVVE